MFNAPAPGLPVRVHRAPGLASVYQSGQPKLKGLDNRAEIYAQWFKHLLAEFGKEESGLEKCMDQLAEISFQQMLDGKVQRYQKEEPGYDKSNIEKDRFDLSNLIRLIK